MTITTLEDVNTMEYEKSIRECTAWADILALTPVEMLLPAQQEALTTHMQDCQTCAMMVAQYKSVDKLLYHYFTMQAAPLPAEQRQNRKPVFDLRHLYSGLKQQVKVVCVYGAGMLTASLRYLLLPVAIIVGGGLVVFIWRLPVPYVGIITAFAMLLYLSTAESWTMQMGLRLAWSHPQIPEVDHWGRPQQDDMRTVTTSHDDSAHRWPQITASRKSPLLAQRPLRQRVLWSRRFWLVLTVLLFVMSAASLGIVLLNPAKPPGKNIGISTDGSRVFDVQRPDGDLKRQAAQAMAKGQVSEATKLWKQALAMESNDAELLIYQENQRVLASKHPYITFVVGTYSTGRDNLQGAHLVQKKQNDVAQARGGTMLRLAIAISDFDDASTTEVAEQIVQLAHQDHTIVGVMGWPTSSQTLAALKVLDAAHLPLVSPTATSDMLTGRSSHFFRVAPSDTQQAKVATDYARQVLQDNRVALFEDPNNPYSHSLAAAFRKSFVDSTHAIVYHGLYTVKGDPTALIRSVQDALSNNPDLLYFAGYVDDASIVMQHLPPCPALSKCLKMMGGDGLASQGDSYSLETYKGYGRLLFTSFAFADNQQNQGVPQNDLFFKDYAQSFDPQDQYRQGTYGYNMADTCAMLSYDAVQVLLHASTKLLAAGKSNFTGDDLRQALAQVTGTQAFQGVSGRISFGPNGNVIGKAVLVLVGQPDGQTKLAYVDKAW